mmetsp:Transcript_29245/g.60784  ORF Transcript_29245/g.60784 Transcript_29245/m.60784 type:complete len:694 (+) Transcript_29245:164-2245(+)
MSFEASLPSSSNPIYAGRPNPNIFFTGGYHFRNNNNNNSRNATAASTHVDDNDNANYMRQMHRQCMTSIELIFSNKITWLLVFGPMALVGKSSGLLGEATCFVMAGLALIPLAERLSFVTEEVARHTNQTIGALLNATFGNAPELLISSAALQEGFYRVVQLTLLGSMLTNLLFVFGLSCLIGGLRFQVQELRVVSGNAPVGMLMLAVAGLALPAALQLSSEMVTMDQEPKYVDKNGDGVSDHNDGPSLAMVGFSRFDALIMVIGYGMYLLFQLGTHEEEFEDLEEEEHEELVGNEDGVVRRNDGVVKKKVKARKNKFCRRFFMGYLGDHRDDEDIETAAGYERVTASISHDSAAEIELPSHNGGLHEDEPGLVESGQISGSDSQSLSSYLREKPTTGTHTDLPQSRSDIGRAKENDEDTVHMTNVTSRKRVGRSSSSSISLEDNTDEPVATTPTSPSSGLSSLMQYTQHALLQNPFAKRASVSTKSHCSDGPDEEPYSFTQYSSGGREIDDEEGAHMSFKAGLVWLFIITISISAMSDILVDTIDGFAYSYGISEVFTSLVILPYFSNIAEQVSAVIFAYRNEMDLCIGITVGSAVQIALFVLPGSVLIGWTLDRSMSLFFRGFETCCLIFSVSSVAAVLQGGSTTYLTGAYLIGVYFMIAAGFWFHELENLSIDGELTNELTNLRNHSGTA